MTHFYFTTTPEKTKERFDTFVKQIHSDLPSPRTHLAITNREDGTLIGKVSSYWESIETNWLCAGITLYDHATWKKGIGHEALNLWVDYLFQHRPEIVRLDLRTWSGNVPMMKLAEKLGFTLEARFRNARLVDGKYYDSIGYGILREEWNLKFIHPLF